MADGPNLIDPDDFVLVEDEKEDENDGEQDNSDKAPDKSGGSAPAEPKKRPHN